MENKLYVSPSPHIHGGDSISKNMYGVLIALVPAFLVSLYFFGLGALIVTVASVFFCVLFEYLIQKFLMKKEPTIYDGSAILTGVLLAFNLPSNLPVWIILIGALAAIGIGKMSFGGLGNNIFNPALTGRIFLLISFPAQMTTWPVVGQLTSYADATTGATVLSLMNEGALDKMPTLSDMLIGNMGGSLGEVSTAVRYVLYVMEEDHHLARSGIHLRHGICLYRYHAPGESGSIRKPVRPSVVRRSDVGSYLHGDRLCDFADEQERYDCLRCRHWYPDNGYPSVRFLSRRYVICHLHHEWSYSAHQQLYET